MSDDDPKEERKLMKAAAELVPAGGAAAVVAGVAILNPIAGIVAAGLAPFAAARLTSVAKRRLIRTSESLASSAIDFEEALDPADPNADLKTDILRDYITTATDTDFVEKLDFLLHLLEFGIKSDQKMEILFVKRVLRTVSRIDELEMIILAALSAVNNELEAVAVREISELAGLQDLNIVASGLSVLESEGLLLSNVGKYKISDYGAVFLQELRSSGADRQKTDEQNSG